MAEAAPSVVAFKIVQALFNVGVALWGVPFLANVEPWDVPDPWLLFGRIVVMICHAANVFAKPFQGFVDVVGGPWSRGAKFEPHSQEGASTNRDRSFFADIVEPSVGGASSKINGRHLAVVIFYIQPGRRVGVCTESVGFFDLCGIFFNVGSGSGDFISEATEFPAHFFRPFLFLPLERDAARSAFPPRPRPRPR